jgi:hypothetical protein
MVKKNCEVWQKMGLFRPDSDPANQLYFYSDNALFSLRQAEFDKLVSLLRRYHAWIPCKMALALVQILISGLQLPNFIFNGVKFFAELPAFNCKICLVKNKIFAVSPQNQNLNKFLTKTGSYPCGVSFNSCSDTTSA